MTLTRVTCPECGAGLQSPVGYTPGQTVTCSKCETDFTVGEQGSDADEFEPRSKRRPDDGWSYKNSWIRYAVLGVMLVTLGVLVYMLYDKRTRGEPGAGKTEDPDAGQPWNPTVGPGKGGVVVPLKPLAAPGSPAGGGGKKAKEPADPPDDAKKK